MEQFSPSWASFLQQIDVDYAYRLAKRMEQFRTNPALGYRTAGSQAEFETGEMLLEEMRAIGLQNLRKDPFSLDAWEFHHARLKFTGADGNSHLLELGGYQTQMDTQGWKPFTLVDAGRGTAAELDRLDVVGKLVLVDINQRDDWWISYPVYQAHLRGAAAVIAVQQNGYGEVDSAALNAQNICGPADAPAFSLSQRDAALLRSQMHQGQLDLMFDAKSQVRLDQTSYNIVGELPGQDPDSLILFTAHYDSYFSGFQDDNTAVAMLLGIARALVRSGYQPRHTLVFCAMAAEEWGMSNTKYDWSTGAYNQLFRVRPEWRGKAILDLNFELPAHAHDHQDIVRCVYEYGTFIRQFTAVLPHPSELYPGGISVVSPVLTWSDDFSIAIAGVPSLVNDFADSPFMQTHYHSQFDNDGAYDEQVYLCHHRLYGLLALAFDCCLVAPLDFRSRLKALRASLETLGDPLPSGLTEGLAGASKAADTCYNLVQQLNARLPQDGGPSQWAALRPAARLLERTLLQAFQLCEDVFVRLGWRDEVLFPHQYAQRNLALIQKAQVQLGQGNHAEALEPLCQVDVNWYARYFDPVVCRQFSQRVLEMPEERLMWGAGRVPGLCDLSEAVRALASGQVDAVWLERELANAVLAQQALLKQALSLEANGCRRLAQLLEDAVKIGENL